MNSFSDRLCELKFSGRHTPRTHHALGMGVKVEEPKAPKAPSRAHLRSSDLNGEFGGSSSFYSSSPLEFVPHDFSSLQAMRCHLPTPVVTGNSVGFRVQSLGFRVEGSINFNTLKHTLSGMARTQSLLGGVLFQIGMFTLILTAPEQGL